MKILNHLWNDLKRGENIDLYVLLIVAIGLSIVSLLGFIPNEFLTPTILTALVLLAVSNLVGRYRVEQIHNNTDKILSEINENAKAIEILGQGKVSARNFFQTRADRPPMEIRLKNAKTVDFLGTSLIGLAVTNQSELRTLKDAGAKIRLIVSNPDNESLQEFLAMRYLEADSAQNHKNQVSVAISNFKSLIGNNSNGGSVEVRITNQMQSFSYMGIDISQPQGYIQIEYYLNKVALSRNPIFLLYANSDTHWYNEFKEQFEFYWNNSFDPYKA